MEDHVNKCSSINAQAYATCRATVAVDLMGPLPTGESLLVVVDYYSRFCEVGILLSTTVDKVFDFLGLVFTR